MSMLIPNWMASFQWPASLLVLAADWLLFYVFHSPDDIFPPAVAQESTLHAEAGISARIFEALDPHVAASMKKHRTPGIALALTDRNGLVGVQTWGYADIKAEIPVVDETLFQIGSITKSFTALALLQAQEDGIIDIDEPVTRYLPWFKVKTSFEPIRVRHLMSHTAGIPANRDDIYSSLHMAVAVREQSTAWAPGSRFLYSNVGYQTLHALLESTTQKSLAEIIEKRFLEPLSMTSSTATIRLESRSRQAVGYFPAYDDRPTHHSRSLVEAPFLEYSIGDGCIQSTAGDLAAYVRMWLNRGAGPSGRIVTEESFAQFDSIEPGTKPTSSGDNNSQSRGYGLGVNVIEKEGVHYLRHSGGMLGFVAHVVANTTDGFGVAVLMNGPGDPGELGDRALEIWRALERGEELPALPKPEDPSLIDNGAEYAGTFRSPAGSSLELRANSGGLQIVRGAELLTLERQGKDTFYTPDPEFDRYHLIFGRDKDAKVVELSHGADWYTNDKYSGAVNFDVPEPWATFAGRYRNFSPWFPYFEVIISKGHLVVITGEGGESSSGQTRLIPLGEAKFQVGEEVTPETVQFFDVIDGRATRATWSGHQFFRQ